MKALIILSLICIISPTVFAQSATVTWTTTHQTMDGFGAMDDNLASPCNGGTGNCYYAFTTGQADAFFSPTSGIGLSIMRTTNDGCPDTGACAVNATTVPNIGNMQKAVAAGAQIYATLQAPGNFKYSGHKLTNLVGADGGCVDTSNFAAYANYIVSWIQFVQGAPNNVPVAWVAAWNEPNANAGGQKCLWPASLQDTFIKTYLGPAIATAGLTTKIAMSDDGVSNQLTSETCFADSACAAYVSVLSFHGYGTGRQDGMNTGYCCNTAIAPPANTTGKHIWQSEVNGGFTYNSGLSLWSWDPSMADALVWATSIHDYMTITNANAWFYWNLADCCNWGGPGTPTNSGLMLGDLTTTSKRYYVVGNWSKYVRSGWVRIDATVNPASGVYVTAFKDPSSDSFAIVAINQNSSAVAVDFSLSGFPSLTSVTPTVTSASVNLEDQPDVTATGAAFSDPLPAMSVVTFHVTSTSSSSKIPAPPTALTLTIN